jgi:GTPase SAR1 family protein
MEYFMCLGAMESNSAGTSIPNSFKIVLLGEGAVGKSSILMRYVEDKFVENNASTIQAAFAVKKMNVDGHEIELNIW